MTTAPVVLQDMGAEPPISSAPPMPPKPIAIYLREVKNELRSPHGTTELSYRGALQTLLKALLPDVTATEEPKQIRDCGRPDYVLTRRRNKLTLGYVETKGLGARLDDDKHKEQFDRYRKALDNIIFTNYLEFQLWRGDKELMRVEIAELRGDKIHERDNFDQFVGLIKAFENYKAQLISSSHELARRMADKARLLAHVAERALTDNDNQIAESKKLEELMAAVKEFLLRDITPKAFADVYAQTIAYGMFAARLHDQTKGAGGNFSRDNAAKLIPKSNPLLGNFFEHVTGYNIDNRVQWIVDDLAAIFRVANVAELMADFVKTNGSADPFIHFYETFLSEYDPRLRERRGVYYTPKPVVDFIVRAVDDILKEEFQLAGGLADTTKTTVKVNTEEVDKQISKEAHKVQILDPAAGTGTFLASVVEQIYDYEKSAGQEGMWPDYVKQELLPRLNGFEVLMAPYAMAHLKLEMILQKNECKLNGERLRIFLTNSLEEHTDHGALSKDLLGLAKESEEANRIKEDAPVMVVLGNPPYQGESKNKGAWIVKLMGGYKQEPGGGKLREKNLKWLNDDYVKFIRYGQHFIDRNGEGLLAYINNHSFLDNPTFRGMRWHLLRSFDKIYILDLHGNTLRKEKAPDGSADKNVFDIRQGVSINLFVKTGQKKPDALGKVFHCDLFGARESKYEFLWRHSLDKVKFKGLKPAAPHYFFTPRDYALESEYQKGFSVADLMPVATSGVTTARDRFTIHYSAAEVRETIETFLGLSDQDARERFNLGADALDWKVSLARKDLEDDGPDYQRIVPIMYRPFDRRHTYYTGRSKGFHCRPREKVMRHFLSGENVGLALSKQFKASPGYHHVFVTKEIFESSLVSNKTSEIGYGFPLYLYPDTDSEQQNLGDRSSRKPNLNMDLVKEIAANLKMKFAHGEEQRRNDAFSPEDLLDYIYAVLHSPGYRKTYREFLKTDFPRAPFPANKKQFLALVDLGAELRALHLMESEKLNRLITDYPKKGDHIVRQVKREKDKVRINKTQYFAKIPDDAWDFHIGGFQPAQKYLKDRKGRELTYDERRHYQKIIVSLVETEKIMRKIDAHLSLKTS